MDDDLRAAIDRLVRTGGRLTIQGAAGASLVLDQPGIRFGILEVRGRLTIRNGDAVDMIGGALPTGWTDPTVTQRLGREIRLHAAESSADAPHVRSRTWRVPPTLASEIADEVRAVLGEVASLESEPLATREPRSPAPAAGPGLTSGQHQRDDDEADVGDEPIDQHRAAASTVPTPLRAIGALVLVAVVAIVWAGMIRGAPRSPSNGSATPVTSPLAGGAPASPSPAAPDSTSTPAPATAAAFRSHLVGASSEEAGPASAAVDGDPVTAWHAAFGVPQWIEIALDTPSTVTEVFALIAQSEPGVSRHMIQVAQTGGVLKVIGVVDRQTGDGDEIRFDPATPIENVERIRIETLASPSNVGWYEVIVR